VRWEPDVVIILTLDFVSYCSWERNVRVKFEF